MSDVRPTTSGVVSAIESPVIVGLAAALLWAAGELALRRGLGFALGDELAVPIIGLVAGLALAAAVLAPAVAAFGVRAGIPVADWELSLSARGALAGVGAVLAYYLAVVAATLVASTVLGLDGTAAPTGAGVDGPTWVLAAFVAANGLLVPLAEEVAWRGVVQTALVDGLGALAGVGLTAALFVAKHVLVDLGAGPLRLFSLLALAVAFGVLRHRYGTGSSIAAHVLANTSATLLVVLA